MPNEQKPSGGNDKPKPSRAMKTAAALLVVIAFAVVAWQIYSSFFYLPFDPDIVRRDGGTLYLVAIGEVGFDAIAIVRANIEREFPELGRMKTEYMPIPDGIRVDLGPGAVSPVSADALLDAMARKSNDWPDLLKAMGVIEEPLYFEQAGPERDIWGLTDAVGGNFGVVSTTMKRREIEDEGYRPGTEEYAYIFDLSLGKSALHEFGHLIGLRHCQRSIGCPMEVSSPMAALKERGNAFCTRHRAQLRRLYEKWGIEPIK